MRSVKNVKAHSFSLQWLGMMHTNMNARFSVPLRKSIFKLINDLFLCQLMLLYSSYSFCRQRINFFILSFLSVIANFVSSKISASFLYFLYVRADLVGDEAVFYVENIFSCSNVLPARNNIGFGISLQMMHTCLHKG